MKFLSYGVMVYMLLALIWWTILLSRNNNALYKNRMELANYSLSEQTPEKNIDIIKARISKEYTRNKYMILGEGMVFGISLIIGLWFIQKAYIKEIKNTTKQKNFLLSITHELKSPIAAINLITETLIKRKLPEEKVVDLQESILSESTRLEKLINNLLLATKIENDYQYNFETLHLNEIILHCVKRLKLQNPEAVISCNLPDQPIMVQADKESIISVFTNLLENSIKYSIGIPKIDIDVSFQHLFVQTNIADAGIGIPNIEKMKVKEQFYRVGNEETRQTKGTGLGLYIVDRILAAHKGKIKIKDNKEQGTIVSVLIPLKIQ